MNAAQVTPKYKVRRAMDRIYDAHALFATIIAKMAVHANEEIGTMATDGQNLFYCPSFVDKLTIEETTWVVLHEAGHVFLGHHLRLGNEPRLLANVAADLALNDLIKQLMPNGCLQQIACIPGVGKFADMPVGKDAETYLRMLKDKAQAQQPKQQPNPQDGEGAGEGEGSESSAEGQGEGQEGQAGQAEGENEGEGEGQGSSSAAQQPGEGSGSDAAGEDVEGEGSSNGPSAASKAAEKMLEEMGAGEGVGEVLPHPELKAKGEDAAGKAAELQSEWEQTVAQAINTAKQCGMGAGNLYTQWEERLFGPTEVNWRQLLRRFMQKMTREGFSYSKPNRRSSWRKDVILPVRKGRNAGRGVVIVDTSGSMSDADCNVALRELESVLRTFQHAEVVMVQCDTREIREGERVYKREDFPLKRDTSGKGRWYGRGGTDLNPAFERVKELGRNVQWLIVVSDMQWSYDTAPDPKIPTCWLAVNAPGVKPKFGQVLHVKAAQAKKR